MKSADYVVVVVVVVVIVVTLRSYVGHTIYL